MAHPGGRPTDYTPEYGKYICDLIATHPYGLKRIAKEYGIPDRQTIYNWARKYPEFFDMYLEARRFQAHGMFDSLLDLPDEIETYEDKEGNNRIDSGILGREKLRFESIKHQTARLEPTMYGDAKQIESLQQDNERYRQELLELRAKLDAQNKKEY